MLSAERNDFGGNNGLVAKVGIIVSFELEKACSFSHEVEWKEVLYPGLPEEGFLIFLLSPVVATLEFVLLIQQPIGGLLLHQFDVF